MIGSTYPESLRYRTTGTQSCSLKGRMTRTSYATTTKMTRKHVADKPRAMRIDVFSNLQQSITFLRGRKGTYLKRFLRRYRPNNARLRRRRALKEPTGLDPALLSKCCTRMDHLPVFLEYNIHVPRARLSINERSIILVDTHRVIRE